MNAVRLLLSMILIALVAGLTVAAVSYPSRASLNRLLSEAAELAVREAALNERLSKLTTGGAGGHRLDDDVIWKSDANGAVEVVLQTALISAADAAGLRLTSYSVAATPAEISLPVIACDLELTGDHASLARFLAAVETLRPALAVSSLWLRQLPPDPERSGAPLTIRLTVWGFKGAERTP